MLPRLTRRRVFGGVLLLFGILLLGIGTWQQDSPFLIWGIASWIAALLGLAVLMIQRTNLVMQVCALNRSDIQQLMELQRKNLRQTTRMPTEFKAPFEEQAEKLKRHAGNLDRLSSDLEALCKQLASDRSTAANWRQDHSEKAMNFRSQFADFVASVAEWMAIAEAEAKQGVAELAAEGTSSIGAGVDALLQRFDRVDDMLSNVHQAAQDVPGAIAKKGEQIESMSRSVQVAIQDSSSELINSISRTVKTLNETRATERESMLEAVQSRLHAIVDAVAAMQQAAKRMNDTLAADSEQIETISKSVKSIIPAQRTEIARAKIESIRELEATLQLQTFLVSDKPMPLLGGWAMGPVSMLGVVTELVAREPELVLECGCGTSTLWIAKALKRIGKGRVVSLEHLKEYHAVTSRALLAAGLDSWVDLRLAPLRTHRIGKEPFKWYDLKRVELAENSIDFLVIDGPPKATGPLARYPALPLLERMLADQAVIILDDANRPEEVEVVARWLKEYPAFQELGELGERTKMFKYSISGPSKRRVSAHLQAL
jgi:predicted O-methyltransferase YrrM